MAKNEKLTFGYKTVTGRIATKEVDSDMEWDGYVFKKKVFFNLVPGETIAQCGIVYMGRWFWNSYLYEVPAPVRNKDGSLDPKWLPTMEITFTWSGPGIDSEPVSGRYQAPHGPDEACTCLGCGFCDGVEMGCTCDIDWEAMREDREEEYLNEQSRGSSHWYNSGIVGWAGTDWSGAFPVRREDFGSS